MSRSTQPTTELQPVAPPQGDPEWRRRIDTLSDEIATLAAQLTSAEYRLLCKIREFDACDGWYHHGARSCAHWLNWRIGLGLVAARERVRVARALGKLPQISTAMERGRISYSKVRALTRIATAETEKDLLENAMVSTASHIEKMVRLYRQACRPEELRREAEQQEEKFLRTYWDDDGMLVLEGRLPAEEGALVEQTLEELRRRLFDGPGQRDCAQARAPSESATPCGGDSAEASCDTRAETAAPVAIETARAPGRPRSWSWQRAEGLVEMARAAACGADGRVGPRAQVTVHVDAEVLRDPRAPGRCDIEGGSMLAAESMRRLSCDGDLVAIFHGEEGPEHSSRRQRKVPPQLWRTLWARDRGCVFPGCTCERYLQAHHVRHWADGGPTERHNLILTCSFHHRLLHEGGFSVEQTASGLEFRAPDGELLVASGSLAMVDDPLIAWRRHHPHPLDADALTPDWQGESPDYEEMLRPLFERDRRQSG